MHLIIDKFATESFAIVVSLGLQGRLPMKLSPAFAIAGALVLAAGLPLLAQQRPSSGPVARYDMRAGTVSGMGGMGQMNPMSMMFGGGGSNAAQHELLLRLGSSSAPAGGSAKADHFMPPSARLGRSVPLTYRSEPGTVDEMPQKPKGRLLIYWGCGEHAPKGQPVVIDFARVAAGQMPPGVWTSATVRDWGPTAANSRTFGRWPNEDNKYVKPDSSLVGDHRVAGNYSPEISFRLAKDFMAPLSIRTRGMPSGATMASWTGIPDATGYLLFVMAGKQGPGGRDMGDMVMWTSSATRQFGGGLNDWLTPGQVATLVRDRTILAPTVGNCAVPAEVKRDGPDFRFGTLTAFGPMEEFSYPPRPADPRAAWNLQWTARIRHRSTTSWMEAEGMMMGGDEGMGERGGRSGRSGQEPACRPRRGGLGGMLGGALGMPGGGC